MRPNRKGRVDAWPFSEPLLGLGSLQGLGTWTGRVSSPLQPDRPVGGRLTGLQAEGQNGGPPAGRRVIKTVQATHFLQGGPLTIPAQGTPSRGHTLLVRDPLTAGGGQPATLAVPVTTASRPPEPKVLPTLCSGFGSAF